MAKGTPAFVSMVGGKARQGAWIIDHLPRNIQLYVEPYAGAATVLINRTPTGVEVLNDIDHHLVSLFRFLRDVDTDELYRSLVLTPFSREEYAQSKKPLPDDLPDVEKARRLFIRYNQAYGGVGQAVAYRTPNTDGGWAVNKLGIPGKPSVAAGVWVRRIDRLHRVAERLRMVQIESHPALHVLKHYDTPETVFYVDPPYLPESVKDQRSLRRMYAFPMSADDHAELLELLVGLKGMVLLSGYTSETYGQTLVNEHGWSVDQRTWNSNVSKRKKNNTPRAEAVWSNPALAAAVAVQPRLI
jgi:DNA adenine methylase